MTTLLAGLKENNSSPANLSHCHPGSTCSLRWLMRLARGSPQTVTFKIIKLFILYLSFLTDPHTHMGFFNLIYF